jgi:hypothetical protein
VKESSVSSDSIERAPFYTVRSIYGVKFRKANDKETAYTLFVLVPVSVPAPIHTLQDY